MLAALQPIVVGHSMLVETCRLQNRLHDRVPVVVKAPRAEHNPKIHQTQDRSPQMLGDVTNVVGSVMNGRAARIHMGIVEVGMGKCNVRR